MGWWKGRAFPPLGLCRLSPHVATLPSWPGIGYDICKHLPSILAGGLGGLAGKWGTARAPQAGGPTPCGHLGYA